MTIVLGIRHGFEVLGIAPRTSHIFGRTSSLSREKPWIGRLGLSVDYGLELDRVPPVVTNVVNIPEAVVPRLSEDVGERRLLGRQGACSGEIPIAIGNAIDDIASDAELVQMILSQPITI
jgi:hypothetical protein